MPEPERAPRACVGKRRWEAYAFALIVALIVGHRLFLALSTDFPINDGGLFYAFIAASAESFPALPSHADYNGLSIPFAYPPLAFWIGGLLTRLGADPFGIVHLAPIAMNLAYVLLFAFLLRRNGASLLFVAIALLFLCVNLRSFEWLVMGGGLSRGLGALFLMLMLLATGLPRPGKRFELPPSRLMLAGLAAAGAILSHLEWGLLAAATFVLVRILSATNVRDFLRSALIAGLVALPPVLAWLLAVVWIHGPDPFEAASHASPWNWSSYADHLEWVAAESIRNLLIPIGLTLLVRARAPFWPLFLLLCIFLTPRHASTPGTLALAVAAASGATWLIERAMRLVRPPIAVAAAASLLLVLAAVQINSNLIARGNLVRPLNADERAAMAWVAREHPGENFVILANLPWWYDRAAEWFPILADAHGVNTLQGREWLPNSAYARWYNRDMAMKLSRDCQTLMRRMDAFEPARFVWVQTRKSCFAEPDFRSVFRNEGVEIFRRIGSGRAD